MTGVIIVTHDDLGKEFLASVERILGRQELVSVIPVRVGDGLKTIRERIGKVVNDAGFPRQKIILVDIFGGTPSNASLAFAEKPEVEILSGLNLPALITLFSERADREQSELVSRVLDSGQKGIINVKQKVLEKLGKK